MPGSEASMCTGGEGTFADDPEVRKSLAAAQLGRKGQPEPHALVGMQASEGAGPCLCLHTLRSSASLVILQQLMTCNNDVPSHRLQSDGQDLICTRSHAGRHDSTLG